MAADDADRGALLFPEGVPKLEQPHDGSVAAQEFRPLAEAEWDGRTAVVYALVADDDPFNPTHRLHLAILRSAPGGEAVVGRKELTRHSPMDLGKAGAFESVTAAVNWISDGEMPCAVVGVQLASRIHGRGSISGGLDVFLALDDEGDIEELAQVRDTFAHRRLESGRHASVTSDAWVVPFDEGSTEVYFEITARTLLAAAGSTAFEEFDSSCTIRGIRLGCSGGEDLAERPCDSRREADSRELARAGSP